MLTASPATVSEGAGATQVTVTVKLGGNQTVKTATPVKVQIGAATDTATEGTDYATVADFTVTIAAGQNSGTGTFTLTPTDDSVAEISENIAVIGHVKGHTNVNGTHLTITDNDAAVSLSATPASVNENAGATKVTVTATLTSGLSSTATSVTTRVGKTGDSAVEITDYAEVDDFTISIPSGEKSATGTFTLTPVNDKLYEGASESLTIDGSATNATVSGTSVSILDSDASAETKVTLSLKPKRVKECSGATKITVTAKLPDGVSFPEKREITISVGESDDSATSGTDYKKVKDFTLAIPAGDGDGLATFDLEPIDDSTKEGDETITVSGSATLLDVDNDAEVTIEDDDQPIIILTMNPANIPENDKATKVTVTASLWSSTSSRCMDTNDEPGASAMMASARGHGGCERHDGER